MLRVWIVLLASWVCAVAPARADPRDRVIKLLDRYYQNRVLSAKRAQAGLPPLGRVDRDGVLRYLLLADDGSPEAPWYDTQFTSLERETDIAKAVYDFVLKKRLDPSVRFEIAYLPYEIERYAAPETWLVLFKRELNSIEISANARRPDQNLAFDEGSARLIREVETLQSLLVHYCEAIRAGHLSLSEAQLENFRGVLRRYFKNFELDWKNRYLPWELTYREDFFIQLAAMTGDPAAFVRAQRTIERAEHFRYALPSLENLKTAVFTLMVFKGTDAQNTESERLLNVVLGLKTTPESLKQQIRQHFVQAAIDKKKAEWTPEDPFEAEALRILEQQFPDVCWKAWWKRWE